MRQPVIQALQFAAILIGLLLFSFSPVKGADEDEHGQEAVHHSTETTHEEDFNAGHMIIEHIIDAHDWHIMDIGDHSISVPLPIILIDGGKPVVFMSSKFHHGHASYKGYKLETEGENKGKIVKVTDKDDPHCLETDTNASLPLDFSITKIVMGIFVSIILLLLIFVSIGKAYKKREGKAPKGMQNLLEPIIIFVRDDIARAAIGEKKYENTLRFLLTVFFFIFFNNLWDYTIFPFGANVTGNIAVTGIWHFYISDHNFQRK